jgi:tetratricopeptide (TPR) repeat protein
MGPEFSVPTVMTAMALLPGARTGRLLGPALSLHSLDRAQAIYLELGYTTEHANLYVIFGEVFIGQGRLQLAIEHSRKALELYREAHHQGGVVRAIANIGIAHGQLGRYQEAVTHIRRGIALAHEVGIVQLEGKARVRNSASSCSR